MLATIESLWNHKQRPTRSGPRSGGLVIDTGSQWTITGRLSIAGRADTLQNGGTGALNIHSGGTVSVAQGIVLFSNGVLRLQGGTLDMSSVSFQSGGQFLWTSGTRQVGTYSGNLLNRGGALAAGATTIEGSYSQQSAGAIEIEIGGTAQGTQHDFINVTGSAQVDGELKLKVMTASLRIPARLLWSLMLAVCRAYSTTQAMASG